MHSHYIMKVDHQIIIILILLLLLSLRLNLLHTKHNFFSKKSTSKFFIFFCQLSIFQYKRLISKLKTKNLNIITVAEVFLFYILFINKLNNYFIKQIMSATLVFTVINFFFYVYKVYNKKFLHLIFLMFFIIYLFINIRYILINFKFLNLLKKNLNLFLFNQYNNTLLYKHLSGVYYNFALNNLYVKNYTILLNSQYTIKKLVNYI